jgi:hypothetical protein
MDCGCRQAGCWRRPSRQRANPPIASASGSSVQQHALPQTSAIQTRGFGIKRQRVPRCCCPVQSILASSPLVFVFGGVWTRRQFRKSYGGDCGLIRQQPVIDHVVIDHHGRIEESACRISHRCAGRLQHQDPLGSGPHRPEVLETLLQPGSPGARTGAAEWAEALPQACRYGRR